MHSWVALCCALLPATRLLLVNAYNSTPDRTAPGLVYPSARRLIRSGPH